jgi:KaiC/GvpD/RAD55 family RecA-like ATPase
MVMCGPGTGKTVFALQALANAAQDRKQPGIFVAFEEGADEIFANAATFGWQLPALARTSLFFLDARLSPTVVQCGDFELSGMLAILEANKQELGAGWIVFDGIDVLLALLRDPGALIRIAALLLEHQPCCMVIDPLSAISRTDALSLARAVCNRIIYRLRDDNITAFVTSLVEGDDPQAEATELQQQAQYGHKRRQLQFAEAARITALQLDLERQRAELARCTLDDEARHVSAGEWQNKVRTMRSAEAVVTAARVPGKRRAARISARSRTNGDQEPRDGL